MACLTWAFITSMGKTPTVHGGMRSETHTAKPCFITSLINYFTYFLHNPQMAAFLHFLNASQLGHVAASVEVAWYLSTGSLEGVSQDVERAVM